MLAIAADGNIIVDADGNTWLDMQSGILNVPLGHKSLAVDTALEEIQIRGLINSYGNQTRGATKLSDFMSEYKSGYVWHPFNTGAEALEKALQIAYTVMFRNAPKTFSLGYARPRIAVLKDSFHGKNLSLAWASLGDSLPWGNPLDLIQIDPYMGELSDVPIFDVLIFEPVQGHDGFSNDEVYLRELCSRNGAILIADEMITGFMRCGKRFMSGDTADIIVTGKGISGGAPFSMVGYRRDIPLPQGQIPVGWRTTAAGNNLSTTIAWHVLRELDANNRKYQQAVAVISGYLTRLGFDRVRGALGYKRLSDFTNTKKIFEERRIIASWHNPPWLRVGPSFITTEQEFDYLEAALREGDEV